VSQLEDDLLDSLRSGDRTRVQAAIADLKDRMRTGKALRMAPFGPEILDAWSEDPPEDTQLALLKLIRRYVWFTPQLSDREKVAAMVALALRSSNPFVAAETALALCISDDPNRDLACAIDEISRQGLQSPARVTSAENFLSRLIDTKREERRVMLGRLREWPLQAPYTDVIDYIKPQLRAEELLLLQP
jgi:hypothetical protein